MMSETIQLVDSADVAARAASVLHLIEASKRTPPSASDAISEAITFLDEAINGSALVSGQGKQEGFSGDLSPLCWATDTFLCWDPKTRQMAPDAVARLLVDVRSHAVQVKEHLAHPHQQQVSSTALSNAIRFFDALAGILAERASANLRHSSGARIHDGLR